MSRIGRARDLIHPRALGAIALAAVAPLVAACALDDEAGGPGTRPDSAARATNGGQFEFSAVVPGVYHARGVGDLVAGSNAAVIVNEHDVLLVDSHISPAAASALLEELATLSDRPVRFVANTHWHFDHVHGNQVYPPEVEIIGHEATRAVIAAGGSNSGRSYESFIGVLPDRIARLEATLDTVSDDSVRAVLRRTLDSQRAFHAQVREVVPTPPNTTLSERLTLFRGEREIRFLFFGRGHTEGDVVVHLPRERVLITGDLITAGIPYMGDGFVDEWIETLEHLKSLDFEWIVPGHGMPFRDRGRIGHLQDYLRDLWNQTVAFHERGLPAEEAARRVDMRSHADHFDVREPGVPLLTVTRIYELLDGAAG